MTHILQRLNKLPYNEWLSHDTFTEDEWKYVIHICQTQKRGELTTNGTDADHSTITKICKQQGPYES